MSKPKGDSVSLDLRVICKYRKGKRKKRGVEYFVYVVHQVNISLSYIHQDYRKRFGIESSYRLKNLCRVSTTTKKPTLRLLFVGIAFLLVNIWVNFLWKRISRSRRVGILPKKILRNVKSIQTLRYLAQFPQRTFRNIFGIRCNPLKNEAALYWRISVGQQFVL